MAIPEPVENEFRTKGTQKSDRELYLQKQIDTLKDQLNSQLDKTKALRSTFQSQMDKMREVNDKLQTELMGVVQKHDDRLIKYMDLSDQYDALHAKLLDAPVAAQDMSTDETLLFLSDWFDWYKENVHDLRGKQLPKKAAVPDKKGGKGGAAEVLAEGES